MIRPEEHPPEVVPLSVAALRLLDEQGFFSGDTSRQELVDGVLIMVPPPGSTHQFVESQTVEVLLDALTRAGLRSRLRVQPGGGFQIGEHTLLGPDLMLVRRNSQPKDWTAEDVVIMIEIAWSSLTHDLGDKARLYAAAGIAEYWVLDVADSALIIHRDPSPTHYGSIRTARAPDEVSALLVPELTVAVGDLF
ncbi:MAG: Uma2 family endonuclease [Hyphomonadaceae bacterium]|nr:Uma2 family endonuclease [Hyphomonadaceae bacterium]